MDEDACMNEKEKAHSPKQVQVNRNVLFRHDEGSSFTE